MVLFFLSCYWRYKDEHDVFIYFFHLFCMSIALRNHPPTLGIITPKPWGRITPQPTYLHIWPNWLQFHNFFYLHWIFFQKKLKRSAMTSWYLVWCALSVLRSFRGHSNRFSTQIGKNRTLCLDILNFYVWGDKTSEIKNILR